MKSRRTNSLRSLIIIPLIFTAGHCLADSTAGEQDIQAILMWESRITESVPLPNEQSSFLYQMNGSMKLSIQQGNKQYFDVRCAGIDVETKSFISGYGYCAFTDQAGEQLYGRAENTQKGVDISFNGGSGKWRAAQGELTTATVYTHSPKDKKDPVYRGVSEGIGMLNIQPPAKQ